MEQLGKLEEVDVHDLWKHEQYDFSNWLAEESNIELLNDVLGLTLVDLNKEVYVGAYRCDLVAIDETTGTRVVIENQLENSNHDHLGKIITYASGLDAKVIVWIVKGAREEHRSAIEWLNNNTRDLNFFLLEIHAYRIGNSAAAPKFEVIESPNEFIQNSQKNGSGTNLNASQSERLAFWTEFNEVVTELGKPFNLRKPTTDHWYNVAIGTSEASISINLVNKQSQVDVELYINENKDLFDKLHEKKTEIEHKLGFSMDWRRLNSKKASRIVHSIDGLNFDDHSNYPELMGEIIQKVQIMKDVFSKEIKEL